MTPFGRRLRELRAVRGVTLRQMAAALDVTPTYLSALEHGRRGAPSWLMIQRIITFFNVIWDEAEELQHLAALSHPRITVNTAGLAPEATELANRLARDIASFDEATLKAMLELIDRADSEPADHRS